MENAIGLILKEGEQNGENGGQFVLILNSIQTGTAAYSASYTKVMGAPSPRVTLQRSKDHCSAPPSAEVKNVWSYTSTPTDIFMAWCLINYAQGQFYFYL
jgi:hypothetical protein